MVSLLEAPESSKTEARSLTFDGRWCACGPWQARCRVIIVAGKMPNMGTAVRSGGKMPCHHCCSVLGATHRQGEQPAMVE